MFAESVSKAYSSCFIHALVACMRLLFFKLFSNFVHICPNFQIFCSFLSFLALFLKKKKTKKKRMPLLSRIGTGRILKGTFFEIWVFRLLENAFPAHFLTSDHTLFIADKLHPPPPPPVNIMVW